MFIDDLSPLAAATGAPAVIFDRLQHKLNAMSPEAKRELIEHVQRGIRR